MGASGFRISHLVTSLPPCTYILIVANEMAPLLNQADCSPTTSGCGDLANLIKTISRAKMPKFTVQKA